MNPYLNINTFKDFVKTLVRIVLAICLVMLTADILDHGEQKIINELTLAALVLVAILIGIFDND